MKTKLLPLLFFALAIQAINAQDSRIDAITQHSRSLSGGFLLSDEYLIQLYPSRVFSHGSHATVQGIKTNNVVGNYDYGSAMYVKDSTFAIGTYLNRTIDIGGQVGVISPVELLLGYNKGNFSAAIIFGAFSTGLRDTISTNPNQFRFSTFGFQPSFSYRLGENTGIDIGIPIMIGNGSNKTGETVNNELGGLGLSFNGRFYSPGIVVPVFYGSASLNSEIPAIPQTIKDGASIFFIGAGRTHMLNNNSLLVYGLNVNNRSEFSEIETANNTIETRTTTTDWGLLLGGEFNVLKNKLKARGSISYTIFNTTKSNQIASNIGIPGQAALGIGYDTRHFRIDAAVSNQLMNNGFFFITGNPSLFLPRITIIGRL